jgi:hypothetical protein
MFEILFVVKYFSGLNPDFKSVQEGMLMTLDYSISDTI